MDIIRLSATDAKSILMDNLMAIYTEALPPSEQKSRPVLEASLSNPNYYFYVLNKENVTVGFSIVYAPDYSDYCLLEYMAVDHTCRSEGLGGKLLDYMIEQFAHLHMVIEIESPYEKCNDVTMRYKRKIFYERHNSLCVDGLSYILPLETGSTPPDMLILINSKTYTSKLPKEKLRAWLTDIYTSVYSCNVNDERIDIMMQPLGDEVSLVV